MAQESSPRKLIFASLFAAILGLIDTAILTAQHYRIANEGLMQKSFCTLSQLIDCDTALTSAYAHTWNIPNSELGFLYYAVVAVLMIWALSSVKHRRPILDFTLILSGAALIFSAYMAYLLAADLKILCLFCIGSHILALTIFIAIAVATKMKIQTSLAGFFPQALTSLIIFGVGILFFFGLNEQAHSGPPLFNEQALIRHFYSQEPIDIPTQGVPTSGLESAPITIAEFSDFQCPFCRRAAFSIKPYLGRYRKDVRIAFFNYPLDQSCNSAMKQSLHPTACTAAKAALCAYKQTGPEGFWKLHDLIFENQKKLSHSLIAGELSPQIGMNSETMASCIASNEIEGRLARDVELGNSIEIQGTPAVYINGRYLRGWLQPEILRTIVEYELKRINEGWVPPKTQPRP